MTKSRFQKPSFEYQSLESRQLLAALLVTNTNDSGAGSLREAINDSNFAGGMQEIIFDLPGSSDRRIELQTELPAIFDEVQIIGHSQPGFDFGDVVIEIDGSNIADPDADGFVIDAEFVEIFGLAIGGFGNDGIEVRADNVTIGSNYLGLDLNGNENANGKNGVRLDGSNSTVIFNNVISGNGFAGVLVSGESTDVAIQNNTIGTSIDQTTAIPNYVGVMDESRLNAIIDNVIAGNEWVGIGLTNATASGGETTVLGNHVGVTPAGLDLGNVSTGIYVLSSNNTIGAPGDGNGNVVGGNGHHGIMFRGGANNVAEANLVGITAADETVGNDLVGMLVIGSQNFVARSNLISGNNTIGLFIGGLYSTDATVVSNYIGTDSAGTADRGNGGVGFILNGATNALIQDNVIAGNDRGGFRSVVGDTHYRMVSNKIGTDFTGTRQLHNDGFAMLVFSDNNQIGDQGEANIIASDHLGISIGATTGNTVAHNFIGTDANKTYDLGLRFGVYLYQSATDTRIENNTIHHVAYGIRNVSTGSANQFDQNEFRYTSIMGIDNGIPWQQDSSTPNGEHMVPPDLTEQTLIGANQLQLTYTINADVDRVPVTVQFFVANYNGSGRTFLGSDQFSANDLTAGSKTITLDVTGMGLLLTDKIVATATDASGNTSEFSLMI